MIYTVRWSPQAEQALASLWTGAVNRQAITESANAIDHLLGTNPYDLGESRSEDQRVLIRAPLGVFYSIQEQRHLVIVHSVWAFGKRSRE